MTSTAAQLPFGMPGTMVDARVHCAVFLPCSVSQWQRGCGISGARATLPAGRFSSRKVQHGTVGLCGTVAVAAVTARATGRVALRAQKWQTGMVVLLQHCKTGLHFELAIEKRGKVVLLSSPSAPFHRMALPTDSASPPPPPTSADPMSSRAEVEVQLAMAIGTRKDTPLLWKVARKTARDGQLGNVVISSASRPDLCLSASASGKLVVCQTAAGDVSGCSFVELGHRSLSCGSPRAHRESGTTSCAQSPEPTSTRTPRSSASVLEREELHAFARDGFLVVRGAVPDALCRAASAVVLSELGRPGAVVPGGSVSNSSFDAVGKLEGGVCNWPQLSDLLLHPRSGAGACTAQLMGVPRMAQVAVGQRLPCQVALRFPEPLLAEASLGGAGLALRARPLTGRELAWHVDGSRQRSYHPFTLLVGVALSDCGPFSSAGASPRELHGNLCVWPGSHEDLRRAPASRICDVGVDLEGLLSAGAPLKGFEGLSAASDQTVLPPGRSPCPVPLRLRKGDCVLLHPRTAHAAAPNYSADSIRVMAYFRVRHPSLFREAAARAQEGATCNDVFFDLPAVSEAVGPTATWESAWQSLQASDDPQPPSEPPT